MNTILIGLLGAVGCVGVLLVVAGVKGTVAADLPTKTLVDPEAWETYGRRIAMTAAAFIAGWAVTGWLSVGVLAAGMATVLPLLVAARTDKTRALAKTEALTTWVEMLRDTISSHAGINQALVMTADVAPEAIRAEVQMLVRRSERGSLAEALSEFAETVAHPISDLVAAALTIATQGRAKNLPDLLAGIAEEARSEATAQMRIETGRSRIYTQARLIISIALLAGVGMFLGFGDFMAPYETTTGQLVLTGICGAFSLALWFLVALSKAVDKPRLLAGAATLNQPDMTSQPERATPSPGLSNSRRAGFGARA